jgi:signal transduction histidine kinase
VVILFVFGTAFGAIQFSYHYLNELARANHETPWIKLIEEFTGAYTCFLMIPFIIWAARRFPLGAGYGIRNLPVHVCLLLLVGGASTSIMWASRSLLFPIAGLGSYDYGRMPTRYFMEFPMQVLWYSITVSLTMLYDRQTRATQLERSLAQAQLHNLRLQMQPHFLFNTLNTISSVMYEDVRLADKMIARLSDLLRMSLESSTAQEVTLEREIEFLRLYVETMKARFEEKLHVAIDAADDTRQALVPPLLLQPLVENSIRHGGPNVDVRVSARRENGTLLLEVRDHGPGIHPSPRKGGPSKGVGLTNTAERLERLYGGSDRLDLRNDDGLVVTVKVPFHVDQCHVDPNPAGR